MRQLFIVQQKKKSNACIIYSGALSVGYYHGGLGHSSKKTASANSLKKSPAAFSLLRTHLVCNDKSDIRYAAIHYDLPESVWKTMYKKSVEQAEIKKKSAAILLYQSGDERIHYFFNQLSREQRQSFELYLNMQQSKRHLMSCKKNGWS